MDLPGNMENIKKINIIYHTANYMEIYENL